MSTPSTVKSDDPITLPVDCVVTAKFRGASCEAKIVSSVENVQVQVELIDQFVGSVITVPKDAIIGKLKVGENVTVKKLGCSGQAVKAVIQAIKDESQYTVVFNDGDKLVVKRKSLRLNGDSPKSTISNANQQLNESLPMQATPFVVPSSCLKKSTETKILSPSNRKSSQSKKDECDDFTIGTIILAKNETGFFPALIMQQPISDKVQVKSFLNDSRSVINVKDISVLDESKLNQIKMLLPGLDLTKVEEYMKNIQSSATRIDPTLDLAITLLSSDDECLLDKDFFLANLINFLEASGVPFSETPIVNGVACDLCVLYRLVDKNGGWSRVTKRRLWKDIHTAMDLPVFNQSDCGVEIAEIYKKYLRAFYEMNKKLGSPTITSQKGVRRGNPSITQVSERLFKPSSSDVRGSRCVDHHIDNMPPTTTTTTSNQKAFHTRSKRKLSSSINRAEQNIISTLDDTTSDSRTMRLRSLINRRNQSFLNVRDPPVSVIKKDQSKSRSFEISKLLSNPKSEPKPLNQNPHVSTDSPVVSSMTKGDQRQPKPSVSTKHSSNFVQQALKRIPPPCQSIHHSDSISTKFNIDDIDVNSFVKVIWSTLDAERSVYVAKVLDTIAEKKLVYVHYVGWNSRHDNWVSLDKIININCTPPPPGTRQSKPKIIHQTGLDETTSSVSNTDMMSIQNPASHTSYSKATRQYSHTPEQTNIAFDISQPISATINEGFNEEQCKYSLGDIQTTTATRDDKVHKSSSRVSNNDTLTAATRKESKRNSSKVVSSRESCRLSNEFAASFDTLNSGSYSDRFEEIRISPDDNELDVPEDPYFRQDISDDQNSDRISTTTDELIKGLKPDEMEDVITENFDELVEYHQRMNTNNQSSVSVNDLPDHLRISRRKLIETLHLPRSLFDDTCTTADMIDCLTSNLYDCDSTTFVSPPMSSTSSLSQSKRNTASQDLHRALVAIGIGRDRTENVMRHELTSFNPAENSCAGMELPTPNADNCDTAGADNHTDSDSNLLNAMNNLTSSLIRIQAMFKVADEQQNKSNCSDIHSSQQNFPPPSID